MTKFIRKSTLSLQNVSLLSLGLLLAGCGGGSGGGSSTGSTQTSKVGPVAVTFSGHPQASVTASTSTVTAEGQAGASYSNLSMNPAPSLNSTFFLFARFVGGNYQIYTSPDAFGQTGSLLVRTTTNSNPSISQSGVIAFQYNANVGNPSIATIKSDGSGLKVLSVPGFTGGWPAISPNGATIVYQDFGGSLYSVPSSGGAPTKIYTGVGGGNNSPVVWSPNGSEIAFTDIRTSPTAWNTFEMSPTGGAATNVTPSGYQGDEVLVEGWSPDGSTISCDEYAPGASTINLLTINLTLGTVLGLTGSGFSDRGGSYSPDGQKIAFYRSNAGGAAPGIYVSDVVGSNLQLMLPDPTAGLTGPVGSVVWSPFLEGQTFVGAHGTITASPVNGFVAAQNASQFSSLLTFTTTTPSTATVAQSGSNSGGAPIIFTLGGDSINNISYTNAYNGSHQSLALTSTPLALVTVDGSTGQVDLVAPAIAGKARPALAKSSGNALTYNGSFSAVYDNSGKNLAPGGASTIQIDRATGRLIPVH